MNGLSAARRGWFWAAGGACALAAASIGVLALLPGRTTSHAHASPQELSAVPRDDGFEVGPLHFDLKRYAKEPSLAPLKRFYEERCAPRTGLEAAECIATVFASAFPHGYPKHEFVDAAYDPAADLADHMAGAPGHCVTRSGLIAAILLSSGVAARQVQAAPISNFAHNALEVFDARWGWVVFDPTYGTIARLDGKPTSAIEAINRDGVPDRVTAQLLAPLKGDWDEELMYPDPWLYTRTGAPAAAWPFRGTLVHAGTEHWLYGRLQVLLREATLVLLASAPVLSIIGMTAKKDEEEALVADATVGDIA